MQGKHPPEGRTRLHRVWDNMKTRCYNPANKYYHRYGGRGITVCDEWRESFTAFKKWALSNGYANNLTLDRIDNNKGYFPDNCRWATQSQQMNNTSTTRFITIDGETKSLNEWSKISGVNPATIRKRIDSGYSGHDLLLPAWNVKIKPRSNTRLIEINGVSKTISQWAAESGIKRCTIDNRLRHGIQGEELLKPFRAISFKKGRAPGDLREIHR